MTTFVGIVSAGGGIGRTTAAIHLASALQSFGRSVLVVDSHLKKPNMHLQLGFLEPKYTIHGALLKKHDIMHAVHHHDSGLRVIIGAVQEHNLNSSELVDLFSQILDHADVIVVDTPPTTDSDFDKVLPALDGVIILTHATQIGLHDAKKTMEQIQQAGKKVFGVLLSHTNHHDYEVSPTDVEKYLGVKPMGEIPYDSNVLKAQSHFTHTIAMAPHSKVTHAYKKVAAKMLGVSYEDHVAHKSIFAMLKEKFFH